MATVIYPSPIFGPVHSRRLGVSLGINLLPADGKFCTFDCIYCECGFNGDHRPHQKLPTREEVKEALEARLMDMQENGPKPDVLTRSSQGFSRWAAAFRAMGSRSMPMWRPVLSKAAMRLE